MTTEQYKRSYKVLLILGALLVAPGVLYLLYGFIEYVVTSVLTAFESGDISTICKSLGMIGLPILFVGACMWAEAHEQCGYDTED